MPGEQVNSDWNATEGLAEILNKPTVPEGPLVCPITIDNENIVTLLDGAPTKEEILSALKSGRQVIGLQYSGSDLVRHMLCTADELDFAGPTATFIAYSSSEVGKYGILYLY